MNRPHARAVRTAMLAALLAVASAAPPVPAAEVTFRSVPLDSARVFLGPPVRLVLPPADSAATSPGVTGLPPGAVGDEAPPGVPPDSMAALRRATRGVDDLWVLHGALLDPASIDSIVERASRMGVRGLLVQVVARGDAYYRSRLLPRAEPLGPNADADPLEHLVRRAHASGLEVHAWMNCMLVWSAASPPRDPRHVIRAHPEWVAALANGTRMSRLSARARKRMGVEGVYLAAAHPAVRTWLASVAGEIASGYDVDGIHLDYIRQPDLEIGGDPTTRARFALEQGIDPARIASLPAASRAAARAAWRVFQRDQITAVVGTVRDTLNAVRPGILLSAAVVSDSTRFLGLCAQAWPAWLRDERVDRAYVMCYSPEVQRVMDQLVCWTGLPEARTRVVPGIAVYNTTPSTAAVKLRGARALGYARCALYSYDSLFTMDRGWPALEQSLADPPGF